MIGPLVIDALRATKRLLQDEQNELLDACRRARGRVDAARLLPDADTAQRGWAAALRPGVDQAYLAGRAVAGPKARGKSAPDRLAADLAIALTDSLRERLRATIDAVTAEGPYESAAELHRALAPAIGARYREWKSQELETRLGDLLCAAYARGAYDGTPSGARLQWVPAELEQCPDADDNALEPTVKGECFPTGQAYPPAHPGCRCFVVPAAIGTAEIGPAAVGDEETPV